MGFRLETIMKWYVLLLATGLVLTSCSTSTKEHTVEGVAEEEMQKPVQTEIVKEKKKVLYVDSYNMDFQWVQDITTGMLQVFDIKMQGDSILKQSGKVDLHIIHMDTKTNPSEEYAKSEALRVKAEIENWQPDLIIASDDNASKYLIAPYYKNTEIPVVFCGINWDASEYGFPAKNITGMVEVTLVTELIKILEGVSSGSRIAYITANDISEKKNAEHYKIDFNLSFKTVFVNSFTEFQKQYTSLQSKADMIILGNIQTLQGFNPRESITWISENTKIPTGAMDEFMAPYVSVACAKSGEEQGRWAAQTALRVLKGEDVSSIQIEKNKDVRVFLNMRIASKIGLKFAPDLVKNSVVIH